jgi:hypothetical protein
METALEHLLTNFYKVDMLSYMDAHPEDYGEAIELAVSDKQPYAWRAAWLLWSCMEENDRRIKGYVNSIIDSLNTKNDNHQRELLKILLQMEFSEEIEGFIFDECSAIWEKVNKRPSVRLTALKIIIKIAKNHPELMHDIGFLLQSQYMESLSPAVRKAVSKMVKASNFTEE